MREKIIRVCSLGLVLFAMVGLATSRLYAGDVPNGPPGFGVPEIDASSVVAGLGILSAGVLMIRARRRSK